MCVCKGIATTSSSCLDIEERISEAPHDIVWRGLEVFVVLVEFGLNKVEMPTTIVSVPKWGELNRA